MTASTYTPVVAVIAMFILMGVWKAISRRRNERLGPPEAPHVEVLAGSGKVTVRRPYAGMQGAARSLMVEVDGVRRGKLASGKAVAVALEPGRHSVRVTIGHRSSVSHDFEITPGASTVYEAEIIPGALSATIDLRPVSASAETSLPASS